MFKDSAIVVAGLDLGDKYSYVCVLDPIAGEVNEETRISTTASGISNYFGSRKPMRVALEVGTQSAWVSRAIEACGHQVLVANARQLRLIYAGKRKNDRVDAEKLARLARYDEKLLAPITHRGEQAQADLANIRSRETLVQTRTALVNHVRSTVKGFGTRLPKCTTAVFHKRASEHLPAALRPALEPILDLIAQLNERIKQFDKRVLELNEGKYLETGVLRQVHGVGPLTALTFVLTIEDPKRFLKSREVGPYLGLTPGEKQSGDSNPQQRITKAGDVHLRKLLVQCAHYILGPFGSDSDLRRHGEKLAARGGSAAKKKAITAVARKLAVVLHHLWATGEVYVPLHNSKQSGIPQAA